MWPVVLRPWVHFFTPGRRGHTNPTLGSVDPPTDKSPPRPPSPGDGPPTREMDPNLIYKPPKSGGPLSGPRTPVIPGLGDGPPGGHPPNPGSEVDLGGEFPFGYDRSPPAPPPPGRFNTPEGPGYHYPGPNVPRDTDIDFIPRVMINIGPSLFRNLGGLGWHYRAPISGGLFPGGGGVVPAPGPAPIPIGPPVPIIP